MIPEYDLELARLMKSIYPDDYFDVDKLQEAFTGKGPIRAIVIGADPTFEKDNGKFKVVFGLDDENSIFFKSILDNLQEIGINLDNIYVQNLIKTYFKSETSKIIYGKSVLDCG